MGRILAESGVNVVYGEKRPVAAFSDRDNVALLLLGILSNGR